MEIEIWVIHGQGGTEPGGSSCIGIESCGNEAQGRGLGERPSGVDGQEK